MVDNGGIQLQGLVGKIVVDPQLARLTLNLLLFN
jgi:hypothetical protein